MAQPRTEIEVIGGGIDQSTALKGSFVQNMLLDDGQWKVRPGFGVVAHADFKGSMRPGVTDVLMGYSRVHGAHLMRTSFGHDQIVVLASGQARVGNRNDTTAMARRMFFLRIFDLTTGDDHEEILTRSTADGDRLVAPLADRHGALASNLDDTYDLWLTDPGSTAGVSFAEVGGNLLISSPSIGTVVYRPASFESDWTGNRVRPRFPLADYSRGRDSSSGYEESAVICRLAAQDGLFSDGFAYLTESDWPNSGIVASLGDRAIYVDDKTLWFSDRGAPSSIAALNFVYIPSRSPITAVREILGALMVWTATDTYLYLPPQGAFLVSDGRTDHLSDSVGCVSQGASAVVDGKAVWVSSVGLYASTGQEVSSLSEPVEDFWGDGLRSPLTAYLQDSGDADLALEQPRSSFSFDPDGARLAFCSDRNLLILSNPAQSCALVLSEGQWVLWNFETVASEEGAVSARSITRPIILADTRSVYMVAGPTALTPSNATHPGGGVPKDASILNSAITILEMGRGGALDFSVSDEDARCLTAFYEPGAQWSDVNRHGFIFGPPMVTGSRFYYPEAAATNYPGGTWLVPVYLLLSTVHSTVTPVLDLQFTYDNVNWLIKVDAGTDNISLVFPPERLASSAGYTVATAVGNAVTIQYDGTGPPIVPFNIPIGVPRLLFYLPFCALGALDLSNPTVSGFGIVPSSTDVDARFVGAVSNVLVWMPGRVSSDAGDDAVIVNNELAQPVDWVYCSRPLVVHEEGDGATPGGGRGERIRVRGLNVRCKSTGHGESKVVASWSYGLLNTLLASEDRLWAMQVPQAPDSDTPAMVSGRYDRNTVIPSVRHTDVLGVETYLDKIFNNGLIWGDGVGTDADDEVLIDDTRVVTLAFSDRTKGEWFRYMMFGHTLDRAESLALESATAAVSIRPGRRRGSRSRSR